MQQTYKMPAKRLIDTMSWEEICQKIMDKSQLRNNKFHKWLSSKEHLGGMFFDPLMWKKCYLIQNQVNTQDIDHFIVNSGSEGLGKTTLSIQQACVLDPNWNLSKLLYKPLQLLDKIEESKPGECLILDEGNLFLFSREAMSGGNKIMVKLFALFRQKNLIIIINVPNFFTLDSYVRDHRTRTLNWISSRGKYQSYKGKAIRMVSNQGVKFKQIAGIRVPPACSFKGWFAKYFPNSIDEDEYKKYKKINFDEFLEDIRDGIKESTRIPDLINITEAMKILPMKRRTIQEHIQKGNIPGKHIGSKWYISRTYIEDLTKLKNPKTQN